MTNNRSMPGTHTLFRRPRSQGDGRRSRWSALPPKADIQSSEEHCLLCAICRHPWCDLARQCPSLQIDLHQSHYWARYCPRVAGACPPRREENHGLLKVLSASDQPRRSWKYSQLTCARHQPTRIWWRRQLCDTSGRLLWDRGLFWERRTNRSRSTVAANSSSGQPQKPRTKLLLPANALPPSKLLGTYCNESSAISIWRAVNLTTDALRDLACLVV
jgi:hypothetical protein